MIDADENRMRDGLIVLMQMIGDQQKALADYRSKAGKNSMDAGLNANSLAKMTAERDKYRDTLYAVVSIAKEKAGDKCIACRANPVAEERICLCTTCRLHAGAYGMPR